MAWRDQLLPGSFRGVPFFIDSTNNEFGRRVVVHEYPQNDVAETEDNGARAARILIDGYVLGADYFGARDALLDALEAFGPGRLVHPYRGILDAQVVSVRQSESTREGGMARFQMEFLQSTPVSRPDAVSDTPRQVRESAADAATTANAQFSESWLQQIAGAVDGAIDAVTDAFDTLDQVIGVGVVVEDDIANLVGLPDRLYNRLLVAIQRIRSLASLRRLFGYQARANSTARSAVASAGAISQLVQTQAAISAAGLSADLTYASYDEAIAVRDEIVAQLDAVSAFADDETFSGLQTLRARVVQDIRVRSADLARITHFELQDTLPSLVLAQRLYGSAIGIDAFLRRADDLVARNDVLHPGFLPGGSTLEVLSA